MANRSTSDPTTSPIRASSKSLLSAAFAGECGLPQLLEETVGTERGAQLRSALAAMGADDAKEREKLDVKRFLNRLIGLPLDQQSLLFETFTAAMKEVVVLAKRDGR